MFKKEKVLFLEKHDIGLMTMAPEARNSVIETRCESLAENPQLGAAL